MLKPQVGRPMTPPTQEQVESMVKWVGEDISIPNAARHTGVHPYQLDRWLKQGTEDVNNNLDSIYAQLYVQLRRSQSDKITELLQQIRTCPKNWQALAWYLEKCVREEFGADSEEFKELLASFEQLREDFRQFRESVSQGSVTNG